MRKQTHQISIKSYSQILHQSLTIKMTAVLANSYFVYATPITQHILLNSWVKRTSCNAINVPAIHRTTPKYAFGFLLLREEKHRRLSQRKEK